MAVQVCRSSADWSSGILKEQSIQNAYIELIRTANHYIYIENQFFITSTQKDGKVVNVIGAALVERILSAAKDGRKFKIVVIIPTIPCFSGELPEAAGIRCIMAYQYKSINRGGKSIFEMVEEAGVDPNEYISFYHLRGYDRLNNDPEMIKKMEETSGVTYHQAEVASARLFLGDQGYVSGQKVAIKVPVQGGEELDSEGKKKPPKVEEVVMPSSEEEAREIINKFREQLSVGRVLWSIAISNQSSPYSPVSFAEQAAPRDDYNVRDSISSNILHGQPDTKDEPWYGSEESEKAAYVTEVSSPKN